MKVLQGRSGIKVLFRQAPTRLVSFRYVVKCGSVDELFLEEQGLCHALEHMFFAGTQKRTWEDIHNQFRRMGVYSNASTTCQYTEYECILPQESLEGALEVAADFIYNPVFPEDRWEDVEKLAIINEITALLDCPDWIAADKTLRHAFGPDYHDPCGSINNIKRATIPDLGYFKDRYYTGDNIFLSVVGGVEEGQLLELVNKYDRLPIKKPNKRSIPVYNFDYSDRVFRKKGITQPIINILKPLPTFRNKAEEVRAELTVSLLHNFLMNEIREKRGLCYGIAAELSSDLPNMYCLNVATSATDKETKRDLLKETKSALKRFVQEGLNKDALQQARMEKYRQFLGLETDPCSLSLLLAEFYIRGKIYDPVASFQEEIEKLTLDQIRQTAKVILDGPYKTTVLEGR